MPVGMTRCSFQLLPYLIVQESGKFCYDGTFLGECAKCHVTWADEQQSTFFFMDDMRLRMSSISGSGALDEVAQICWFGQPSQALALPASAEVVPGQCSGASAGVLLMIRADNLYGLTADFARQSTQPITMTLFASQTQHSAHLQPVPRNEAWRLMRRRPRPCCAACIIVTSSMIPCKDENFKISFRFPSIRGYLMVFFFQLNCRIWFHVGSCFWIIRNFC